MTIYKYIISYKPTQLKAAALALSKIEIRFSFVRAQRDFLLPLYIVFIISLLGISKAYLFTICSVSTMHKSGQRQQLMENHTSRGRFTAPNQTSTGATTPARNSHRSPAHKKRPFGFPVVGWVTFSHESTPDGIAMKEHR